MRRIVVFSSLALLLALPVRADRAGDVAGAQAMLDAGKADEALAAVERVLARGRPRGDALLVRSSALFVLGEQERAIADLRRAVEIDPALRQGWLNLAGVEIAGGRYTQALEALERAEALDPEAPDNDLNLGAALLLLDRSTDAGTRFDRYLAGQPGDGRAAYQVATNYALAGDVDEVVDLLGRAFAIDERLRIEVRRDRRFDLYQHPAFVLLMSTDSYRPPTGAHQVAAAFSLLHDAQDQLLIGAVTDALRRLGEPYDPTIEVTEGWALVWSAMRIKITNQPSGSGVVRLSAPAERFTAEDWHRRTQALLRAINDEVARILERRQR